MDLFLDKHNLPNLTREEIDNLNRFLFLEEIKLTINNLLKQNTPGSDSFTSEFYQTFKNKII